MEKKLYNGQRVWETVKDLTGLNTDWLSAIIKMPAGGYDELWKKTFVFGELDSIVFFNPELYAACDKNKRVKVTSHFVLPQEGSVGKKNTILPDIVFYLPQIDDSNEPLICTIEQQHKNDSTLASRFFKAVNRLMSQNSIKSVTGFIAYTGTYNGTNEIENDCFSLKYHLTFPKHHILSYKLKDLQEDKRRFARILEAWIYYTDYRKIISRYGA
ncbi:MAG: hypothetical protein LBT38_11690, partial [Deltaproteobacteria bacterium]|nr:hypothetical protein [Deltaproteobacteria bacterium]